MACVKNIESMTNEFEDTFFAINRLSLKTELVANRQKDIYTKMLAKRGGG